MMSERMVTGGWGGGWVGGVDWPAGARVVVCAPPDEPHGRVHMAYGL